MPLYLIITYNIMGLFINNVISYTPFGNDKDSEYYIAELPHSKHLKISKNIKIILDECGEEFDDQLFLAVVRRVSKTNLTPDSSKNLLDQHFIKHGLISYSDLSEASTTQHQIKHISRFRFHGVSIEFEPFLHIRRITSKVTLPLFFHTKTLIWVLFTFAFSLLAYCLSPKTNFSAAKYDIWVYYTLMCLSCTCHEIGHLAACNYIHACINGVGLGVYLTFFRLFVRIDSSIWKKSRTQRIIVDISGIYFQICFVTILICFYRFHPCLPLYVSIQSNLALIVFNSIPFFHMDGYWVMLDFLNTNNPWKYLLQKLKSFQSSREIDHMKVIIFLSAYHIIYLALLLYMGYHIFIKISYFPYILNNFVFHFIIILKGGSVLNFYNATIELLYCIFPYYFILCSIKTFRKKKLLKEHR